MNSPKKIIIGTRGSDLALKQSDIVKKALLSIDSSLHIDVKVIVTHGDTNQNPVPVNVVGKGWFTKEIEEELLVGTIDIAVHSLKDLGGTMPKGLVLAAYLSREDARDALITKNRESLEQLKSGAIIGTDSPRRQLQMLALRPDLNMRSLRGNVPTRLKKLETQDYDAIILAVAGLRRLGLEKRIAHIFDPVEMTPAPGQGILAIQIRGDNQYLQKVLKKINNSDTSTIARIERAFARETGAGCKSPTGAYAFRDGDKCRLIGMLARKDGSNIVREHMCVPWKNADTLGEKLAKKLLARIDKPKKTVAIVSSGDTNASLIYHLQKLDINMLEVPSTILKKIKLKKAGVRSLENIENYDWILFASKNGVDFFMEELRLRKLQLSSSIKIGAVGPETARALELAGYKADLIPKSFSTEHLVRALGTKIAGKRILFPRSAVAPLDAVRALRVKDASVEVVPLYTSLAARIPRKNMALIEKGQVNYIIFTSPSGADAFMKNVSKKYRKNVLNIPVLCIGFSTATAVRALKFKKIHTAKESTAEGIVALLGRLA